MTALLAVGSRAWTVTGDGFDMMVHDGEVVAVGPHVVVLSVDGPWANSPRSLWIVARIQLAEGHSPRIETGETFLDHAIRCDRVLQKEGTT